MQGIVEAHHFVIEDAEIQRIWNLAYDRRPLAMVRCADIDDVRRCVEFARRHSVVVAIRGGGHSYAGFGVADGALQIDLSAFNTVTVDRDRRVAVVGGGTRIKELLSETLAVGLYTPMGACGDVGVAGLALAGGDTSGRGLFGTACDNLIGAQLVTADGEVLELGPGRNEDLFWAIRGGGGNFGVVTRLDFRLHPLRTQHSASFQFGWNDIASAMRTFGELVRETPDEVRASFQVDKNTGAVASCGHFGDPAAAVAYHATWKAAFRGVEPQLGDSIRTPQGEVWATTSLAVDGAVVAGVRARHEQRQIGRLRSRVDEVTDLEFARQFRGELLRIGADIRVQIERRRMLERCVLLVRSRDHVRMAMPPRPSRYRLPCSSQTYCRWPSTSMIGAW